MLLHLSLGFGGSVDIENTGARSASIQAPSPPAIPGAPLGMPAPRPQTSIHDLSQIYRSRHLWAAQLRLPSSPAAGKSSTKPTTEKTAR